MFGTCRGNGAFNAVSTTHLRKAEIKENILAGGMPNQKAEVGIWIDRFHDIFIAIFEKPSVWMIQLSRGQGVDLNGSGSFGRRK